MSEDRKHWSSAQVKALLQSYFGGGGKYAVLFEVRNATGHAANRSIDAVTMSLWPSLGLELSGMEIKISRSDWLRELKDPAKASSTFEYFDRWYLVAPRDVAKIDEIPGPWGWYAPEGDKLVCLKKAPQNPTLQTIDRGFLASLLRGQSKNDDALIEAAAAKAAAETSKRMQDSHNQRLESELERRTKALQRDADQYRKLKAELGDGYLDADDLLKAVRAVRAAGIGGTFNGLAGLRNTLTSNLRKLDEALKIFDQTPEAAE